MFSGFPLQVRAFKKSAGFDITFCSGQVASTSVPFLNSEFKSARIEVAIKYSMMGMAPIIATVVSDRFSTQFSPGFIGYVFGLPKPREITNSHTENSGIRYKNGEGWGHLQNPKPSYLPPPSNDPRYNDLNDLTSNLMQGLEYVHPS